ncbi:MAG TPA: GxxExxY protein [Phnomibacter sp.]|nr:GxxExxY protein [Phnomibacter sp.]
MLLHEDLTQQIIKCFFNVYNSLGYGFLEKVYENAFLIELKNAGLNISSQHKIDVFYQSQNIGSYFADILVEDKVILELKAATCLMPEHEAQLLNYLKATNIEIGMLFNFGLEPEFRRKIFSNNRK